MAAVIYSLCAITSALSAGLLIRAFLRTRSRLLLWSSICFTGLSLNNVALWVCAVTRRRFPVGASPIRQTLQPEAIGAVMEV
ncbi:DUF5985 family protein, partial [Bradyrhizobium sp. LB11.1]|uniref:DUF5985 family protein n=1 Tax=Bradyrhizobium sp. LB11.1 TaxID=3156326 RepID=UPI003399BC7D